MILNRADVRELINFSSPRRKRQKGRKTERQRVAPESIDGHFLEGNCEQRAFFFCIFDTAFSHFSNGAGARFVHKLLTLLEF